MDLLRSGGDVSLGVRLLSPKQTAHSSLISYQIIFFSQAANPFKARFTQFTNEKVWEANCSTKVNASQARSSLTKSAAAPFGFIILFYSFFKKRNIPLSNFQKYLNDSNYK